MTDEELAKEWVKENCDDSLYSSRGQELQKAFIAGLKAGKMQWHDLRKNSNDLPDDERWFLCIDKVWTGQTFTTILKCCDGVFYDGNGTPYDVIAWCEIPKFEETE